LSSSRRSDSAFAARISAGVITGFSSFGFDGAPKPPLPFSGALNCSAPGRLDSRGASFAGSVGRRGERGELSRPLRPLLATLLA